MEHRRLTANAERARGRVTLKTMQEIKRYGGVKLSQLKANQVAIKPQKDWVLILARID